ncbi:MAG TPA: prepilin-type N-terminal cleavage/methylation domain-containing protein [Xanthomonadales bacterium]|nr:prepilin-type N-terminal cleavage/methylation domain-containing protein [Xanthomonadales bacterium]
MEGRNTVFRAGSNGFSFIELMVATAVFSVGMGGMAALMLSASGGMAEAEYESIAHLQTDAMAATLQLGPLALEHLANPPQTAPLCFESNDCTGPDWTMNQYLLWRAQVARELPGGHGVVCRDSTPNDGNSESPSCSGDGPVVTKVFWKEPRQQNEAEAGARRAVVQIPR